MRELHPSVAAHRAARTGTHAAHLLWIGARDRKTGAPEPAGLWTGIDHRAFVVGGKARTYFGAGPVLQIPAIQASTGLEVRSYQISLAAAAPEVEEILRGYDLRLAPVEIHRIEFDGDEHLLADPVRIFKGRVNGAPIVTPAMGGTATATLSIVSNARMLTRYGTTVKSDAHQRRRGGDRFRRYATLTETAAIHWGQRRASAREIIASGTAPKQPPGPFGWTSRINS